MPGTIEPRYSMQLYVEGTTFSTCISYDWPLVLHNAYQ